MADRNNDKPTPFKRTIDAVHETMRMDVDKKNRELEKKALRKPKKERKFDRVRVEKEKVLDQWMTNINYFSTRFTDDLYACLDIDAAHALPGCSELDLYAVCAEALRIVSASRIMRIGTHTPSELKELFLTSWAIPRTRESARPRKRSGSLAALLGENLDVSESLECFERSFDGSIRRDRFEALKEEIAAEAAFYDRLRENPDFITVAYRQLLPIWILKNSSPLYNLDQLSFWRNSEYMQYVCTEICKGFKDYDFDQAFIASGQIGAQARDQVVLKNVELSKLLASASYEDSAYDDMGVVELYERLYGDSIDVEYDFLDLEEPFPELPTVLAKLVWNICACTILGPAQMTDWRAVYTRIINDQTGEPTLNKMSPELHVGSGSVSVRRVFPDGRLESAYEFNLGSGGADEDVPSPGLLAAIGRAYTPTYYPAPQFDETTAPELHRLVMEGMPQGRIRYWPTECDVDSAWHVGFVLSGDPTDPSSDDLHLYIVDLGSANGTRVVRADGLVYLFVGRPPAESKLARIRQSLAAEGLGADVVREVGYLEARRNDVILLGNSQFILQ